MNEVCCSRCNVHLGWMIYCGPTGSFYCDDCKEESDREDEADRLERERAQEEDDG